LSSDTSSDVGSLERTPFQLGDSAVDTLADPSDEEVDHWFQAVRLSTPVSCNPDYAELAACTTVFLDRDDASLNAHAMHPQGEDPQIVIFGGLVRAYALTATAAALASLETGGDPSGFARAFVPRFRRVASGIVARHHQLKEGSLVPSRFFVMERASPHDLIQNARSHFTGMMLTVMAHELGHVVLRHNRSVVPPGGSPAQLAMEHQADAFARAVCESVPFQAEVTFSGFLDALLWAWISPDDARPTTHPGARSRLFRFVDENVQLERYGITTAALSEFVPKG
jgi:hypothetical protein